MSELIKYDAARRALSEAHDIDEVKDIRDKTEAMAAYARQAKDNQLVLWATEIKVRAERKVGQLLKEKGRDPISKGGKRSADQPEPPKSEYQRAKAQAGISDTQAKRWQNMAEMPDEHFETAVETAKEHAGQVSTAHMLRVADELRKTAEMREALKKDKREGQARDLSDPDLQALKVWVPIESALTNTLKAIAAAEQRKTIPFCPSDKADEIRRQWATISQFIAIYARQS